MNLNATEKAIIDRLFSKYQSTYVFNQGQWDLIYDYASALLKRLESAGWSKQENRRPMFSSIFGINHQLIDLFETKTNLAGGLFLLNEAVKVIDQNAKQAQLDYSKFKGLDPQGFDPSANYDNVFNTKVFYHILLQVLFAKIDPQSQWVVNDGNTSQLQYEKYFQLIANLGPYGADLIQAISQGAEIKSFDQVGYHLENHVSNILVYEYHNQKQIPLTKKQFNVKVCNQQPLNYLDGQYPVKIDGITVDGFNDQIAIINRNAHYEIDFNPGFELDQLDQQITNYGIAFDPNQYQIKINSQGQLVIIDQITITPTTAMTTIDGTTYQNVQLIVNPLNPSQINIIDDQNKPLSHASLKPIGLGAKDYFQYFETWISPKLWLHHYVTKIINPQLPVTNNLMLLNFRNLKTIDGIHLQNYFLNDDQYYVLDRDLEAKLESDQRITKRVIRAGWSPYTNYRYLNHNQSFQLVKNFNKMWIKSARFSPLIKQIVANYYQKFPLIYLGQDEQAQPKLVAYDDQISLNNHFQLKLNRSYQEDKIDRLQTELSLENPHLWSAKNFIKPYPGVFGTHWNYNVLPTASMLNYDFDWGWWQAQLTTWSKQPYAPINRYLAKTFSAQYLVDHKDVNWLQVEQFSKNILSPWWQDQREAIHLKVLQDHPDDVQSQASAAMTALNEQMQSLIFFQKILTNKFGYAYDYETNQYHPYQSQSNLILTYGHWMEPMIIDQLAQAIRNNQNEIIDKHFPNYKNHPDDLQVITDKRTLMFRDTLYDSGLEQLVDVDGLVVDRHSKAVLAIIESKTARTLPGDKYYHNPTVQYRNQISLYGHLFQQPLVLVLSSRIADPNNNIKLKETLSWHLDPVVLNQHHFQELKNTYDLWIKTYRKYFVNAINPFTNQFDANLKAIIDQAFANGLKSAPCFEQPLELKQLINRKNPNR